MKAIRYHQFGEADVLKVEQVPKPIAQKDEVLIRIYAAGVLPIDWKIRRGQFPLPVELPKIPGTSFAGVIEKVGSNVTTFEPGQKVFGRSENGTYAEYTTASQESIALIPQSISFEEAATISGGASTAWKALIHDGKIKAGDRVLIHGAAGGVGSFAVQFAKWKNAYVIGTASNANLEFVRSLGADKVIDYTSTPFEQIVHDIDLVLDTVGGHTLERSLSVIKKSGIIVTLIGHSSLDKKIQLQKNIVKPSGLPSSKDLSEIAKLMDQNIVKAEVQTIFPLHEAQQAHILSQFGHGKGRIVLQMVEEGDH